MNIGECIPVTGRKIVAICVQEIDLWNIEIVCVQGIEVPIDKKPAFPLVPSELKLLNFLLLDAHGRTEKIYASFPGAIGVGRTKKLK